MTIAYFNGSFVLDPIIQMKNAVFTTILIENGEIIFLKEHLRRLKQHLKQLNISNNVIGVKVLMQLIEKNSANAGSWRLRVVINEDAIIAALQKEPIPRLKQARLALYPSTVASTYPKLKTLDNFKRKALLEFSKQKGYDDCITFDLNQNILETAIANVFWVKADRFYYPDLRLPYFHGITLKFAIKMAKKMNMKVCKGFFKLKHLEDSSVFYCNSIKKIIPVEEVEGILTNKNLKLQGEFVKYFQSQINQCTEN